MRKIALVNHKGGVGKTTSALNIAAGMARKGQRVLVIDTDPQCNLTLGFGLFDVADTIYDSFSKGNPLPVYQVRESLFVVPCSLDFAAIELEIANRVAREKTLLKLLKPLEKDYDVCIIDCPPSLGTITVNALVAANEIYIPMTAEYFAFHGIDTIIGIIRQVKENLNEELEVKGVFFTQFKNRVLSKEIEKQLEKVLGNVLMETKIRVNVALAESQANGKNIFEYEPKSNGAEDYTKLVKEIIKN